ncbi:MAG: M23 family metallopeptidase [Acidobacteriota bacterium]
MRKARGETQDARRETLNAARGGRGGGGASPGSRFRLRRSSPLLLVSALLACATLAAASGPPPLLWPLPIHEGCTSSFGEYRRTHFHGGVDIRTHQEIGWPVFAVADGRVVRVRREPGGYGRVLYLELNDGRTAVYGHLCRFEEKRLHLESRLLAACERAGTSFPGDVEITPPAPVRAGEVVAYSGDLGVGFPHLHFEIRRGDDLCDPFVEGLPLPAGMTPPAIAGLVFVPREAPATVDGSFEPRFVPAVRSRGGYRLAEPVRLSGAVDAELVAGDHLGVASIATGLPIVTASLDGKGFFSMDLRRISLARFKEAPALFDPQYDRPGTNTFRLRRLPWLQVPHVEGSGLPGDLAPGRHALEVVAENRAGQRSVVSGEVEEAARPAAESRLSLPGSGYRLEGESLLPDGLVLKLSRASNRGVTPLRLGASPVAALYVEERSGSRVLALIPREALPHEGEALTIGEVMTPWRVAAGPGRISAGGALLTLPEGALGTAAPAEGGAVRDGAVALKVEPFSVCARAAVTFPAAAPRRGLGVYFGSRDLFLDNWTGKPVPYLDAGLYALRVDDTAPSWGQPQLVTVPHLGDRQVWIRVTDLGSGPDARTLRLTLDGKAVYPDWDMDTRTIRLDLRGVARGRHVLAGSISDFAGNRAELPPRSFVLQP